MSKKNIANNTWSPSIFNRYIFFESLRDTRPSLASNVEAYLTNKILHSAEEENKDEKYKNYIVNYINMLENLAENERKNEIKYVEALREKNIPIDNYYNENGQFDYIKFIKALQLIHNNLETIQNIIKINKNNMDKINQELNNLKKQSLKDQNNTSETQKLYTTLTENYINAYSVYAHSMNDLMSNQLQASYSEQIQNKIKEIFNSLADNPTLIEKLIRKINGNIDDENLISILQNWCIEFFRQELASNNNDINAVVFNANAIDDTRASNILQVSIKKGYDRVLSLITTQVERIIDSALNRNKNIANMIREQPSSLNELLEMLPNIDKDTRTFILESFNRLEKNIKDKQESELDEEKRTQQIASMKGAFTKKISQLINNQLNTTKGLNKDERFRIINKLMTNYQNKIKNSSTTLADYVGKKLKMTTTSQSSIAEIIASPDFHKFLYENISDIFIPGKTLQYKADLTFNFSSSPLTKQEIKSIWPQGNAEYDLDEFKQIASKHGETFLNRYKELAKGKTSIALAEQAYRETLTETMRYKRALYNYVDDESKKIINTFSENNLNGAISVKDYHYYNNEKGYHMGSMGGGGRVIEAVPNILKMMELGGITGLDAEVIITALLNSFDGSIIGTSLLDDIKSLLIGGAAMMLFDDGFANAEAYLQRMKDELNLNESETLPSGGSLHLLYLNNIYVPQSYVLFNIINQLKNIYNDIITNIEFNNPVLVDTNKNSLELYNPLSIQTLQNIENNSNYPTPASKWNEVSRIAQDNVKIHFMFMAGMLDLMAELEKSFSVS